MCIEKNNQIFMVTIVQKENPVLRKIAAEVPITEIAGVKIKKIIADMKTALHGELDGVAIAAPQIGVSLRIFVVSGKIFDQDFKDGAKMLEKKTQDHPDLVFINPKFIKKSKTTAWLPEGCLSVRWLYGEVKRSTNATISAYNEEGKKFTKGSGGLLAHIFQHEIDHLDGTLFIDNARNLEEGKPEDRTRSGKDSHYE